MLPRAHQQAVLPVLSASKAESTEQMERSLGGGAVAPRVLRFPPWRSGSRRGAGSLNAGLRPNTTFFLRDSCAHGALALGLSGLAECHCRVQPEPSAGTGQASEDQGESKAWSVLLRSGFILAPLNGHQRLPKAEASQTLRLGPCRPPVRIISASSSTFFPYNDWVLVQLTCRVWGEALLHLLSESRGRLSGGLAKPSL